MNFIESINRFTERYFHFEDGQTGLNGLKIASYFFTLGLLPLFAGLAFGITQWCLRGIKKIDPDEEGLHQLINAAAQRINFRENMLKPFKKGESPLENLHPDIRENKLKKPELLTLGVLGQLAQASKTMWHQYQPTVDKAWEERKAAMTIGPQQWIDAIGIDKMKEMGIDLENIPALPEYIDEILKNPCPFNPDKRVYQTHRLVLIPAGLSIDLIGSLMRHLKTEGTENGTVFRTIWNEIVQQMSCVQEKKAYWALITCDVIPGSRNQNYTDQQEMIKNYPGYELPSVLEAIVLATMHLELTGQYLLSQNPWTYTRCREKIGNWPLVVGGFAPSGLSVNDNSVNAYEDDGVVGVRKLCET